MMVSLAVTAGVTVYVYSSGLMGSLQGSKPQQPYLEQVSLDYYTWNLTTSKLTLIIRNVGSTQVQLADFFIAGIAVTPSYSGCQAGVISVDATCEIYLSYSGASFNYGLSYNVRAVTNDGATFNFPCIAGTTS
jgi:squalene cyclase